MDGDFIAGFCDAGFHDDEDIFNARERGADGFRFTGILFFGVAIFVAVSVCSGPRVAESGFLWREVGL